MSKKALAFISLLLLTAFSLHAETVTITKANFKQVTSNKPVIAFMSLGCDAGSYYSSMFLESLENLKGVDLAIIDINTAYSLIGNEKTYDLSDMVLLKDGKILDSSSTFPSPKVTFTGYNGWIQWSLMALKKHGISFQHPTIAPERLDPLPSTGTADLNKDLLAYFSFDKGPESEIGETSPFAINGEARIAKGLLVSTKKYSTTNGAHFLLPYRKYDYSTGFSVHTNVKLNALDPNEKGTIKKVLVNVNETMLNVNYLDGKLTMSVDLTQKLPAGKTSYALYNYTLSEADLKPETWYALSLSLNIPQKRLSIVLNGKQLQDISIDQRFIDFYKISNKSRGLAFYNYRWGAVLDGMADDVAYYNRPLSGSELLALNRKYSKNPGTVSTNLTNAPSESKLNELGFQLIKAAASGDTKSAAGALLEGAPVDYYYQGWTPLLYAAYYWHTEVIKVLINYHSDALIKINQWSALMLAQNQKHTEVITLLEEYSNSERFYASKSIRIPKSLLLPPPKI